MRPVPHDDDRKRGGRVSIEDGDMSMADYITSALGLVCRIIFLDLIPCVLFAMIMQWCSNRIRERLAMLVGDRAFIYMTAPGVAVHELGHALFCVLFHHKIEAIKLFSPEADGTLGYVSHSYDHTSLFQRTGNLFIGTGPIWSGVIVLWMCSRLLLPTSDFAARSFFSMLLSLSFWSCWQSWLWLYLLLAVGAHITLSPPDLKGAADGGIALTMALTAGCLLFGWSDRFNAFCRHRLPEIVKDTLGMLSGVLLVLLLTTLILLFFVHGKKEE